METIGKVSYDLNFRKKYEKRVTFRLFDEEHSKLMKVLLHARDNEGFRKYENESHVCRAAVVKLIREELSKIEVKRGRPRKNAKKQ